MIDKISGPSRLQSIKKSSPAKRRGASNFDNHITSEASIEEVAAPEGGNSLHEVQNTEMEGLLSLQEISSPPVNQRKHARQHGGKMLEQLRDLQIQILAGDVPQHKLEQIQSLLSPRIKHNDKALEDILTQITLRTRIELAKRRALHFER